MADQMLPGNKPGVAPPGNEEENPKIGRMVHGGFRSNIHHQGIENLADENYMGREYLRMDSGGYPDDQLEAGFKEMFDAPPVRGSKTDYKTSKWSTDSGPEGGKGKAE